MNIQKVTTQGGGGEVDNLIFEVKILVFTNIQAKSTLVCIQLDDNGFLMDNSLIFHQ